MMFAFALLLAAQPTTVYLNCIYPTAPTTIEVATDEANGAVTVSIPDTGYNERIPAAFTVDALKFNNGVVFVTINRSTLWSLRGQRGAGAVEGTCKINEAPKRAF